MDQAAEGSIRPAENVSVYVIQEHATCELNNCSTCGLPVVSTFYVPGWLRDLYEHTSFGLDEALTDIIGRLCAELRYVHAWIFPKGEWWIKFVIRRRMIQVLEDNERIIRNIMKVYGETYKLSIPLLQCSILYELEDNTKEYVLKYLSQPEINDTLQICLE